MLLLKCVFVWLCVLLLYCGGVMYWMSLVVCVWCVVWIVCDVMCVEMCDEGFGSVIVVVVVFVVCVMCDVCVRIVFLCWIGEWCVERVKVNVYWFCLFLLWWMSMLIRCCVWNMYEFCVLWNFVWLLFFFYFMCYCIWYVCCIVLWKIIYCIKIFVMWGGFYIFCSWD